MSAATWHYDLITLLVYITLESPVCEVQTYTRYSPWQTIVVDKSSLWLRDPYGFYSSEIMFTNIDRIGKWCTDVNQRTLWCLTEATLSHLNNFSKFFQPRHSYSNLPGHYILGEIPSNTSFQDLKLFVCIDENQKNLT